MSTFSDLENLIGLLGAIDSGKLDSIYDALAQKIAASGSKDLAEAKDLMGEDFKDYVPKSRQALRAQKETQNLEHQKRMQDLEYERAKLELEAIKPRSI